MKPDLVNVVKAMEIYVPVGIARRLHQARGTNESPYLDAMVSRNVIFTHVPKTGGTSIAKALFGSKTTHIPIYRYRVTHPALFARAFKFAIVRNPWDRIYSAFKYLHRVVGNRSFPDGEWATEVLGEVQTFQQFVHRLEQPGYRLLVMSYIHFRPQLWWLSVPGQGMAMDYVGRLEHIQEAYQLVSERLGVDVDLPVTRTTSGPSYVEVYDDAMTRIVGDLYRKDIEAFDYTFS